MIRSRKDADLIGRHAEERVKLWLNRAGQWVIWFKRDTEEDDHAPVLRGPGGQILTGLDLLASERGASCWYDVKWKDGAYLYGIEQSWWTGFDLGKWLQYRAVEKATGIPARIIFLHQKQDEVLVGDLSEMSHYMRPVKNKPHWGGDMALFPRERLLGGRICSYTEMLPGDDAPTAVLASVLTKQQYKERFTVDKPRRPQAQLPLDFGKRRP